MGLKRAMMIGLDGADPYVIERMIKEGRLPNLKKVLEQGVVGDKMSMIGAFPSVTPPNWATLATGNWPRTHGVTCYWNQTLGKDLNICEMNWDSRRVESELIWEAFSREGKRSIMLNYCEAWPPRIKNDEYGVYIDGTGVVPFMRTELDAAKFVVLGDNVEAEIQAHAMKENSDDCIVNAEMFESMLDGEEQQNEEEQAYDPFMETPLVEFPFGYVMEPPNAVKENPAAKDVSPNEAADMIKAPFTEPVGFAFDLPDNAKVAVVPLAGSTARRFFVFTASDGVNYDTVTIYKNKKTETPLGVVGLDKWSVVYDTYTKDNQNVKAGYSARIMKSEKDGSYVELLLTAAMNVEDYDYIYPQNMGKEFNEAVGPFPMEICMSGLEREYSKFELETWQNVFKWHADATHWLFKKYPDWQLFYIHLHGIDIYNHWYLNKSKEWWSPNWKHYEEMIAQMYEFNDMYVGEILKYMDGDTNIIVTSDHAAVPSSDGDANPGIGFLRGIAVPVMQELGYTVMKEGTAKPEIDWTKTKALSIRLTNIYINLKGRDPQGIVEPEEYDALVQQIISDLYAYRHPKTGKRVISFAMTRDEMEMIGMGGPHCGDIFFQTLPTYCVTHGNIPSTCENEGHSMNNLCMMYGPAFKEGEKIRRVIRATDVVPTLCYLCDNDIPSNCEGSVIRQALKGFVEEQFTRELRKGTLEKSDPSH